MAGSAADAWLDASGDMDAEERAKAAAEKAKDMKKAYYYLIHIICISTIKVQELCHAAESQVYGLFDENCDKSLSDSLIK